MVRFIVTDLKSRIKNGFSRAQDMYDLIYRLNGGDHLMAAEMCDWAELAPVGDNWEHGDIDVSIVEID